MRDTSEPTETGLVAAAQQGDEDAFRALLAPSAARLQVSILSRMSISLRRKISIADIYQEAIAAAWQRIGDFEYRGEGSFHAWLASIVDHKVGDVLRRFRSHKRNIERELPGAARPGGVEGAGREATPSQEAMATELEDQLREMVKLLPKDYRRVLHLIHVQGLAADEAAHVLKRSPEATRKLYQRARTKLWEQCYGGKDGR